MNIKEMIKNKIVKFTYYREGHLYYITECGFEFPVPISDTGEATFKNEDKAIYFMRYIRKHIDEIQEDQGKLTEPGLL